jgi:hypothetical protein
VNDRPRHLVFQVEMKTIRVSDYLYRHEQSFLRLGTCSSCVAARSPFPRQKTLDGNHRDIRKLARRRTRRREGLRIQRIPNLKRYTHHHRTHRPRTSRYQRGSAYHVPHSYLSRPGGRSRHPAGRITQGDRSHSQTVGDLACMGSLETFRIQDLHLFGGQDGETIHFLGFLHMFRSHVSLPVRLECKSFNNFFLPLLILKPAMQSRNDLRKVRLIIRC